MNTKGTLVFDIIGTCFSLDKPRQRLVELGAPPHALELWFAQTLRDAFALSHAGSYRPLKEVLEAELPRTLKVLGIEADAQMRSHIVKAFSELEPQPEALEAFRLLTTAGWKLVALTNGSEDSTHKLLERANVLEYFASIFSCDAGRRSRTRMSTPWRSKRSRAMSGWLLLMPGILQVPPALGKRTAFINKEEKDYLGVYPQPEIIASDLVEAVKQIVEG
jgi:2-haloacid dehalogenase